MQAKTCMSRAGIYLHISVIQLQHQLDKSPFWAETSAGLELIIH
jgi:hypothetical protein